MLSGSLRVSTLDDMSGRPLIIIRLYNIANVALTRSSSAVANVLSAAIAVAACAPPPVPASTIDPPAVSIGTTRRVVPGPGIPPDAPLGRANNNLDVLQVGVTIPGDPHLADPLRHPWTRIIVFRSDDDGMTWSTETVVDRGRDLRDPRLLALGGDVFLYYFEAGTNPLTFQPGRVFGARREASGAGPTGRGESRGLGGVAHEVARWSAPHDAVPRGERLLRLG